MENLKEIRWKQRFRNFEKAYISLEKYSNQGEYTELERAGVIQLFEAAFELSWKVMKDYLEYQGYTTVTPRDTIKKAFEVGMIGDGQAWLEALEDRNLTSHTYDEDQAEEALNRICRIYVPKIGELCFFFSKTLKNER